MSQAAMPGTKKTQRNPLRLFYINPGATRHPENITGSAGKGGIKNVRKRKTVGFHKIAFY